MTYNLSILPPFAEFDNMRPTNPLSIIRDKNKGKASVVEPSGRITKQKGKASVVKPKATVRKEQGKGNCFHCQGEGHWKRNCPEFLESLKIKRKGKDGESETFSNLITSKCSKSSSNTWVLDTGASSHICASLEDLANERRLRPNEVTLKLINRASVAAKAIRSTLIDLYNHVLLLEVYYMFIMPIKTLSLFLV